MRCEDPQLIWPHRSIDWIDAGNEEKAVVVPCGKCVACLVNRRSDWTLRLQQEHKVSRSAHFVTLTYDEKHMPENGMLCKRDLQLYLKRLRRSMDYKGEPDRIRYYAVGEYGSKSGRAHYHILLFNCPNEQFIRDAWLDQDKKPIGIVHVGKVTQASIAYVTKYVVQRNSYVPPGAVRPFATMSRRYGIGGRYLSDDVVRWHRENEANYFPLPGNGKTRLPRFYRDKIWWKPKDKERISSAAMILSLTNIKLEEEYYRKAHGEDWLKAKKYADALVLSRVKEKLSFSQTF